MPNKGTAKAPRAQGRAGPSHPHAVRFLSGAAARYRGVHPVQRRRQFGARPSSCRTSLPPWSRAGRAATGPPYPAAFWDWWRCWRCFMSCSLAAGCCIYSAHGRHHPGLAGKNAREDVQRHAGPAHPLFRYPQSWRYHELLYQRYRHAAPDDQPELSAAADLRRNGDNGVLHHAVLQHLAGRSWWCWAWCA